MSDQEDTEEQDSPAANELATELTFIDPSVTRLMLIEECQSTEPSAHIHECTSRHLAYSLMGIVGLKAPDPPSIVSAALYIK